MSIRLERTDVFGLVRPALDAHTLGIGSIGELLAECGIRVAVADKDMAEALGRVDADRLAPMIKAWVTRNSITAIGFSYRLDPDDGARLFGTFVEATRKVALLSIQGGPIKGLYFAGLPAACALVADRYPLVSGLFQGDETPSESLTMLGVSASSLPPGLSGGVAYDEDRLAFGRDIVKKADYRAVRPLEHSYPGFGNRGDGLVARSAYHEARNLGPLMRAHVGPYQPDRREAVRLFLDWTDDLAKEGLLDVLSIGSSQLTQEAFGTDWNDAPNGGGVPIATEEEFAAVWKAARPMLVRAYSGVVRTARMAEILEKTIDIAWHALSLWWFCALDGRGPNTVADNLRGHFDALRYIASTGKPFEPNVPHHFAFRGADDVSYVVSGYVAAKAAKAMGVPSLVLQIMLNTPKYTYGVQDLAKARALLGLARGLEDGRFRVYLQPRGGLDYFSRIEDKAKAQLAAVTALMDDIEPEDGSSPQIIHVVSFSEGNRLADPAVVNESVRITRHALSEYRRLKASGSMAGPARDEVAARTEYLVKEARIVIAAMESAIPDCYSPGGLYRMLADGYFALPYLSENRDEFQAAVALKTRLVNGGIAVVGDDGKPITAADRIAAIAERKILGTR